MITQAIKHWLGKMFAWWPWKRSAKTQYAHIPPSLNQGATQETAARSVIDGTTPQPEVAPRRPTIEEWPERIVRPYPPAREERAEISFPSPPSPTPPMPPKVKEATSNIGDASSSAISSTQEQQLAFLRYLIKRGIVNEGFAQGKVPDQYRRE